MSAVSERFDVRLSMAPRRTPGGADFTTELARAFGVELWVAEHIARHAPTFVKRDVTRTIADEMRAALERLGAGVEILPAGSIPPRPSAAPPGPPAGSLYAPSPSSLPPSPDERIWPSPPPRPSMRSSAPPTARPLWTPAAPPETKGFHPSLSTWLLTGAVVLAIGFAAVTRWLHHTADGRMLGNVPNEATACTTHFGLTGPGPQSDHPAEHTLVVAWHDVCPREEYRRYLDDLASTHRGEVTVLGAALVAANGGVAPLPWPPPHCGTGFEVLPIERGYVSDALEEPAAYLYDEHGRLVAAWRGEMSNEQRQRLTTWLDGKTWDP